MPTVPVVVVGAGPAGLAVSHELGVRGVDHVVLDRGRTARELALAPLGQPAPAQPGLGDPAARPAAGRRPGRLPRPRRSSSPLLDRYAAASAAPVVEHAEVLSVHTCGDGYRVVSTAGTWTARAVVLATGDAAVPAVPDAGGPAASRPPPAGGRRLPAPVAAARRRRPRGGGVGLRGAARRRARPGRPRRRAGRRTAHPDGPQPPRGRHLPVAGTARQPRPAHRRRRPTRPQRCVSRPCSSRATGAPREVSATSASQPSRHAASASPGGSPPRATGASRSPTTSAPPPLPPTRP